MTNAADNQPIVTSGERIPTIRVIAMPADTNPSGDIFGGWLMSQMDLAGSTVATRRARGRTATVAVDGMAFLRPVAVGDEVSIYASVVGTGRTSIRVFVEAFRRHRDEETVHKVTEATITFVAIGADRKPRPVPAE
ncbi:MAG TPA: acyl-CoA thioesterase [Caulobacteraceae bacterium]|jgi:acyl-CoA thioesterase YciA